MQISKKDARVSVEYKFAAVEDGVRREDCNRASISWQRVLLSKRRSKEGDRECGGIQTPKAGSLATTIMTIHKTCLAHTSLYKTYASSCYNATILLSLSSSAFPALKRSLTEAQSARKGAIVHHDS